MLSAIGHVFKGNPPVMGLSADDVAAERFRDFEFEKLLLHDQSGRRIVLLGKIWGQQGILIAERAAFSADTKDLSNFVPSLTNIKENAFNDIYGSYLASMPKSETPDVKLDLIWPCTEAHIKKYSAQGMRMVTETPQIYADHVRPFMQAKREAGRLNWVFNILDGKAEQEDVIYRESGDEGFLCLPDLNWDRKTVTSLHMLALVERRDIWSVRDLKKDHVVWLKHMKEKLLKATTSLFPEVGRDQLKLYVHYQPTYYHFHIHIVHVMLDASLTQATSKALGFENIIGQLEGMPEGKGMADVSLAFHLGEASEMWTDIFLPLKEKGLLT